MSGLIDQPTGMDRRELLQRAAWISGAGALAWAAPAVTTFGARAAAGTGPPGDTIGFPDGQVLVSFIAFVFSVDGKTLAGKVDYQADGSWVWSSNGNAPFCDTFSGGTSLSAWRNLKNLSDAGIDTANPPIQIAYVGTDIVFTSTDTRLKFSEFAIKQATGCDVVNAPRESGGDGLISSGNAVFTAFDRFVPEGEELDDEELDELDELEDDAELESFDEGGDQLDGDADQSLDTEGSTQDTTSDVTGESTDDESTDTTTESSDLSTSSTADTSDGASSVDADPDKTSD